MRFSAIRSIFFNKIVFIFDFTFFRVLLLVSFYNGAEFCFKTKSIHCAAEHLSYKLGHVSSMKKLRRWSVNESAHDKYVINRRNRSGFEAVFTLTFFTKGFIKDVWQGPKYISGFVDRKQYQPWKYYGHFWDQK